MTAALLALVVVAVLVGLSALHLLGAESAPAPTTSAADLQAKKDDLVEALREVDMDFAMGKISAEDRERLRSDLEGRAMRVLAAIEAVWQDTHARLALCRATQTTLRNVLTLLGVSAPERM